VQIIINAGSSASATLVKHFTPTIGANIYAPALGETIRIGEHVQSYSLMLGDGISSSLARKWAKFEGYEVAMVDGRIVLSAGSTVPRLELLDTKVEPKVEPEAEAEKADAQIQSVESDKAEAATETADESVVKTEPADPDVEIVTSKAALAPEPAPSLPSSLFVGDLRLAALKARLNALDIPAEFAGEGVLVCGPGVRAQMEQGPAAVKPGSMVAVRKVGEGEVVVEGSAGRVYWDVRREVYGSLALVGAA
jgi:cleavage and polyadenylation specificity factor subunit 2